MELTKLKGIGPKTQKILNGLGIKDTRDILYYFPRNYEDRRNIKRISEIIEGENAVIICEASRIYPPRRGMRGKSVTRASFRDESGIINVTWFNQPYIAKSLKIGEKYLVYGKISSYNGELYLNDPQYEVFGGNISERIVPVYPLGNEISQKVYRKIIKQVLEEYYDAEDILHDSIRKVYELPDLKTALNSIHFPSNHESLMKAVKRVKFEELLLLQVSLFHIKKELYEKSKGNAIAVCREMTEFSNKLPFKLTNGQRAAIRDVLSDMKSEHPMNRLLQGDVGSGKTIVAAIAIFNAAKNGYQSAFMAPTEILVKQQYKSLKSLYEPFGINVGILTGSMSAKDKKEVLKGLDDGSIDVVVGTHSLIQDSVKFKNLALAVTDEQHRFGVRQRGEIINKGECPHVLVMTATPIPRTLALFIYSDMDISIINELPPGRQKIDTFAAAPSERKRIYNFIKKETDKGRQAYIVCPLVEDSDKLNAVSAESTYEYLTENYIPKDMAALIHGRMKDDAKEDIMNRFSRNEIKVLVSTTVIEVGINVPNATVMVVENADRFGLSQLHQLRGRVGRGKEKSYCILIGDLESQESHERLKLMTKTNDGFEIAEHDMEMRGTGEFFGIRQHGSSEIKLSSLSRDMELVEITRSISKEMIHEGKLYELGNEKLYSSVLNFINEKIEKITFN